VITLEFTHDEALVLYEVLARAHQGKLPWRESTYRIEDQAEQRVLWDVEAMLESILPDVVAPDYDVRLAAARDAVRDAEW
jgi:hypothetical protein